MLRSMASKVAWVGKTASMVFGLALVLALIFGVASVSLSATGGNFILGQSNSAGNQSSLVAGVVGATKSALLVRNSGAGAALNLKVGNQTSTPESKTTPPVKVDSQALVGNLNADELDGKSDKEFLPAGGKAADSDKLDGLDSTQFMGDFAGRNDATTSEVNSTRFKSVDVHCPGTTKVVDGYAQVYPNTAESPIPVALQAVGSVGDMIFRATASEMAPYDGNWGISVSVLCVKSPPGS
jgi:hypothetical protein